MKVCPKCQQDRDDRDFYLSVSAEGSLNQSRYCRFCIAVYTAKARGKEREQRRVSWYGVLPDGTVGAYFRDYPEAVSMKIQRSLVRSEIHRWTVARLQLVLAEFYQVDLRKNLLSPDAQTVLRARNLGPKGIELLQDVFDVPRPPTFTESRWKPLSQRIIEGVQCLVH